MFETAAVRTMKKHLSTTGVYKVAHVMRAQAKETQNWIEESDVVMTFVKSEWECGYSVATQ